MVLQDLGRRLNSAIQSISAGSPIDASVSRDPSSSLNSLPRPTRSFIVLRTLLGTRYRTERSMYSASRVGRQRVARQAVQGEGQGQSTPSTRRDPEQESGRRSRRQQGEAGHPEGAFSSRASFLGLLAQLVFLGVYLLRRSTMSLLHWSIRETMPRQLSTYVNARTSLSRATTDSRLSYHFRLHVAYERKGQCNHDGWSPRSRKDNNMYESEFHASTRDDTLAKR